MKKGEKNNVTVNVDALNYKHPIFMMIEDGDEETIKFYKRNGVPVARIPLPHRPLHYYAIFGAATQEEADEKNRALNNMDKKAARVEAKESGRKDNMEKLSYDALVEAGYNPAMDGGDLAEIVAYRTMIDALHKELGELTEEKLRQCKMVATKESERDVAKEMGIPRTTLSGRKNSTLKELNRKLKDYR